MGRSGSPQQSVTVNWNIRQRNVGGNGSMKQKGVLGHDRQAVTPGSPTHLAEVLVVDANMALIGLGELAQKMGDGGFARS